MKTFTLSLDLTAEQLVKALSKLDADIKFRIEVHDSAPEAKTEPKKRAARGSKVEGVIREALAGGRIMAAKDLKGSLENAGLKPSSLGATLSKMQRAGVVRRNGDGWSLPVAAE